MDNRQSRIEHETYRDLAGLPLMLTLTAASPTYAMKPHDHVIIADTTSAGGDGVAIITLPSLAESVGQSYYIKAPVGATGGDLSIYEKETGAELATYGDMDADNDHAVLFSNGLEWVCTFNGVA